MNSLRYVRSVFAVVLLTLVFTSLAHAQADGTWVSGVGDDLNPCSRTAPCKTFAGAISKTAAGGEIRALDPGGFGAVTITKAITIIGEGTLAAILNSLTTGVIVNAGPNDVVRLIDLKINGAGDGINGINYIGGKAVHVENCFIAGINSMSSANGAGIWMTAVGGHLRVVNTTISEANNAGIRAFSSSTVSTVDVENSRITNTGSTALNLGPNVSAAVRGSALTLSGIGVQLNGGSAQAHLDSNNISFNGTGILGSAGGNAFISNNMISFNSSIAFNPSGGIITTYTHSGAPDSNPLSGNVAEGASNGTKPKN